MINKRQIAEYEFSCNWWETFFQTGSICERTEITDGLPKDAKIIGVRFNPWKGAVDFLVEKIGRAHV